MAKQKTFKEGTCVVVKQEVLDCPTRSSKLIKSMQLKKDQLQLPMKIEKIEGRTLHLRHPRVSEVIEACSKFFDPHQLPQPA